MARICFYDNPNTYRRELWENGLMVSSVELEVLARSAFEPGLAESLFCYTGIPNHMWMTFMGERLTDDWHSISNRTARTRRHPRVLVGGDMVGTTITVAHHFARLQREGRIVYSNKS